MPDATSKMHHTGGQYSLLRFLLGAFTLEQGILAFRHDAPVGASIALVLAGALLAIGLYDRVAAVVAAAAAWLFAVHMAFAPVPDAHIPNPATLYVHWALLAFHLLVMPAPFGAWSARGRVDPIGGWQMQPRVFGALWTALVLYLAYSAWTWWYPEQQAPTLLLVLTALFCFLATWNRTRPLAWLLLLAGALARVIFEAQAGDGLYLILTLFAFDPAWVKPRASSVPVVVFYDGTCGLCHRTTRFLLAEDSWNRLEFAPLQGSTFEERRGERPVESFPDSLILFKEDGTALTHSSAVLSAMDQLGGMWRLLAIALRVIPPVIRDACYDFVASIRHRLFPKPEAFCPLVPQELGRRFLP